ncbi:MAG: hypothetical protein IPP66_16730 [Anaerolineales bacterium]|nr:hypothetical protein [Anaerolineales bacterium]
MVGTTYATYLDLSDQVVCIDKGKYNRMRATILKHLVVYGPMALIELYAVVERRLYRSFQDSISHYFNIVELDLETCGEIRRVPNSEREFVEIS